MVWGTGISWSGKGLELMSVSRSTNARNTGFHIHGSLNLWNFLNKRPQVEVETENVSLRENRLG